VNYHNFQNSPYVITVAATDDYGYVAPFSNPGAALLVSAPGSLHYTDDRVGTSGWSAGDYVTVAGTSYAAPVVSGVVALMLDANPALGYRDVQEILVYAARQTDKLNPGWDWNGAQNWNGGGLHFSHDYGFGLVDATAAVRLAESWQKQSTYANLVSASASHTDNAKIPDGAGSLASTVDFASSVNVDRVVVDLSITHARPGDLVVTLTSPSGTTAVLAANPANGTGTGIVFQTSANAFWGEDSKGQWTLTLADTANGGIGTLNGWKLTALGDAPSVPTVYIYTDAFASLADPARSILHDASGTATLNTAAVAGASSIDLRPGTISTIAGRALEIDSATVIKNAWAGDGNDTIVANHAGNTIQGGRGNDTIVSGEGADTLYGGPGNDLFVFKLLDDDVDRVGDFADGSDVIDFRFLLASLGYAGTDAMADGWISLAQNASGGTDVIVDPHDGRAPMTVVTVAGLLPAQFQEGIDFWTTAAHA
jgi:subtilisin-like proprotein convertase family protein